MDIYRETIPDPLLAEMECAAPEQLHMHLRDLSLEELQRIRRVTKSIHIRHACKVEEERQDEKELALHNSDLAAANFQVQRRIFWVLLITLALGILNWLSLRFGILQ